MTKHHFSFKEVFSFGLAKTKQHAWFMALTFIIISIIMGAVESAPFINVVVALMVGLSLTSIALTISRDHHFTFSDLVTPLLSHKRVLNFFALAAIFSIPFLATLFASLICLSGAVNNNPAISLFGGILTLLLGLFSVYCGVRFKFFSFVVLEHENATIPELIKMSYKLTDKQFLPLLGLLVLVALFNMLGLMVFVVGLFVTLPISLFAVAHVYNKLKEHSV